MNSDDSTYLVRQIISNTSLPLHERAGAAAELYVRINFYQNALKKFKKELIELSKEEGCDLKINSNGKYATTVEKQPPTPVIDTANTEFLRESLGDEFFNKYIAHSYTIRWSEFRNAPSNVKKAFYNIPNIEMNQTYQVKFKRTK